MQSCCAVMLSELQRKWMNILRHCILMTGQTSKKEVPAFELMPLLLLFPLVSSANKTSGSITTFLFAFKGSKAKYAADSCKQKKYYNDHDYVFGDKVFQMNQ